jgi:peptidoglycan/xylan/chitin deacetylase (PgdA/CDA1 family)
MSSPARRAKVSLTFDDALPVHLDVAIPELDAVGLPGTFYINAGARDFTARAEAWARAAANGHELGNHTIFHPGVSSKAWVTEGIALEGYTHDRMRVELEAANRILGLVDGKSERSFAFPCSNPWLGRPGWPRRLLTRMGLDRTRVMGFVDRHGLDLGSQLQDYTPLVRELFPAARCGGVEADSLPTQPPDRHRVRGVVGDGESFEALERAIDIAAERGAWLVFVFHGIGGGHHLSCELEVFRRLLAHLRADSRVDVLTFLDGARDRFGPGAA